MNRPIEQKRNRSKRTDLKSYDPVTVYLTPDMIGKLKDRADQLTVDRGGKVTVTDVVRELLAKHL